MCALPHRSRRKRTLYVQGGAPFVTGDQKTEKLHVELTDVKVSTFAATSELQDTMDGGMGLDAGGKPQPSPDSVPPTVKVVPDDEDNIPIPKTPKNRTPPSSGELSNLTTAHSSILSLSLFLHPPGPSHPFSPNWTCTARDPTLPISVASFHEHVHNMHTNKGAAFQQEFQVIVRSFHPFISCHVPFIATPSDTTQASDYRCSCLQCTEE